ncbi:glycosyltransferase family 1 protein [Pigmentiphaga soli]|uniref:glycosyltransferase family 4 protein n=1 Tax=Pigmentiphaga soli TaxID=1007095 RepID=UPI0031ED4B7B
MTIALISEHASPLAMAGSIDSGGQNVYVANVARRLAAMGHRVDVFTRQDDPTQPLILPWLDGIRVIHVPAGPPTALAKEDLLPHMEPFGRFLLRFMKRQSPSYDVIHANFFMSGLAALQPVRALGLPLVVTFHALDRVRRLHQGAADRFPEIRAEIESQLVREADCLIAECPQDRQDLIELYGADPSRIDIVPCGFDVTEFGPVDKAAARRALGWAPHAFSVLQLGRMVPRKGVDNVIRAVGVLRRRHAVDARLYVVGGNSVQPDERATPELGRLRGIAAEEGVSDLVTFCGRRDHDQLRMFYGAADVFVSTPWYEPFGITPVEAMACACPVIGADVGGIRYTVQDRRTGFLVPPRDAGTLAERLAWLAADPALRRRLGRSGRQRARRLFTWRGVASDLARVYERVAVSEPARIHVPAGRAIVPALAAVE